MVASDFTSATTEQLLTRVQQGDQQAVQQLLQLHRTRLKRMVAIRLDDRLVRRVDPSDVVQETMVTAMAKLERYLRERPIAFYPWLREIAYERLIDLHRRHLGAQRRSLLREIVTERSSCDIAYLLSPSAERPSARLAAQELQERTHAALEQLSPNDREVLVLRLLEQTSVRETAEILGCSEAAVKTRQVRALQRLRRLLEPLDEE